MTNNQFPLTLRWSSGEDWWLAFCPEWELGGHGSTKEEAKQRLCEAILRNARTILQVKDDRPTMEPQMIAVAQQVMANKDRLSELLQEAA